jgi:thiamine biosynthesis lipoprotein
MEALRALLITACAAVLPAACDGGSAGPTQQRLFAMGTWVDLQFEAPDGHSAQRILEEVETLLRTFERDYYAWGDGELARLNRHLSSGTPLTVSAGLARMLRDAQRLSAASGGLFEPGVAGLVELWGFHTSQTPPLEPPDGAAIDDWRRLGPKIAALEIDGRVVRSAARGLQIDLGGVAKGEAVDRIIALLESRGVGNALVNAGGDLRAIGRRGDRAWRVGIKAPRGAGLLGTLELADGEAAFTSGDYERFFDHEGQRQHHILDPTTGYPAHHTQAVTVIAGDGVKADAAATALFVAGPDRWRTVARSLQLDFVLRVDASGRVEGTDPMLARVNGFTVSSAAAPL